MSALWELAPPIFLGTLLAIVAVVFLAGKQRKLMRGPRRLAGYLFGGGCSGRRGCSCGGCMMGRMRGGGRGMGRGMMWARGGAMKPAAGGNKAGGCGMNPASMPPPPAK